MQDSWVNFVRTPQQTRRPSSGAVRLSRLHKLRDCEQVAAVCYRMYTGEIEFLLIRTRGSRRWTFPKGSAERGLTHAQAAALEAFEEAGVHGRIEEAAFARYIRRKRDAARKSSSRSDERISAKQRSAEKEFAVNAHLCEVLRLASPKESNRNRTWFSADEASLRLREGRAKADGAEFARVIDRAVARIQQLRGEACIADGRSQGELVQQNPARWNAPQKDALQRVQFDFEEGYGRAEATFLAHIRSRIRPARQSVMPAVGIHRREILQGEVLQFNRPREKKARALGIGSRNG